MLLILGAGGKTGQAVIRALATRGAPVRALAHHETQVAPLRALGAGEVVVGDLRDPSALAAAMAGIEAVYYICPAVQPDEAEIGRGVIAAAQATGVPRLVLHSVMHPQISALPHHAHKLQVEDALIQSGLSFTILQPSSYMQNILEGWERIATQGVYASLYGLDARMTLVDLDDVGDVAARVLTEAGHEAATYELSGPEVLTAATMAATLSARLGRPVTAVAVPSEQWEARARAGGLDDYAVATLATMFRYYAHHGFAGNPRVLELLLGREPTNFAAFVARTAKG